MGKLKNHYWCDLCNHIHDQTVESCEQARVRIEREQYQADKAEHMAMLAAQGRLV